MRPEPEWWAEARRLRAESLSYAEIGRRLGYSKTAVYKATNPEKNHEHNRRWRQENPEYYRRRRQTLMDRGICQKCKVRGSEPLSTRCVRCKRYDAERKWLGYSTIPLAKGSEG